MRGFWVDYKESIIFFIALCVVIVFIGIYNVGGGRDEHIESARLAIEAQGYTNVQYSEVDFTSCADEHAGYAFDADNVNGVRVRLVACNPDGGTDNYRGNWYIVTKGK